MKYKKTHIPLNHAPMPRHTVQINIQNSRSETILLPNLPLPIDKDKVQWVSFNKQPSAPPQSSTQRYQRTDCLHSIHHGYWGFVTTMIVQLLQHTHTYRCSLDPEWVSEWSSIDPETTMCIVHVKWQDLLGRAWKTEQAVWDKWLSDVHKLQWVINCSWQCLRSDKKAENWWSPTFKVTRKYLQLFCRGSTTGKTPTTWSRPRQIPSSGTSVYHHSPIWPNGSSTNK